MSVPVLTRVGAEFITDQTAERARALWESNPHASQIECALLIALEEIAPLVAERDRLRSENARLRVLAGNSA